MEERAFAAVGLADQRNAQALFATVVRPGKWRWLDDIAGIVNKTPLE